MNDSVRVLVAIASHGSKNQRFLTRLLDEYRSMRHEVDLVVLSDGPKDLGGDVEVRIGAPTENPRSLPFAHRALFAERVADYDLFIYSEDDTLVEEAHVDAFLEANSLLPEDEVPGFLRFEEHPDGQRSYCSIHSFYRWDPQSAVVRGPEAFASYSNQHSACYLLTSAQLRRAIDSGGFLVDAHEGAYDMLVSAATDPYTRCGLHRRLCVTRIDDFLLHHLPNVYLGKLGVGESEFRAQIRAVRDIATGRLSSSQLLEPSSTLPTPEWDVPQHPHAAAGLADVVPRAPLRVLTVGCTSGELERTLLGEEASITGLPVDEVVAAVARLHGVKTLPPDLEALEQLDGTVFDLVLVHQVLHHVADPVALLRRLRPLLHPEGRIVLSVPNVRYQRLRARAGRPVPPLPDGGFEVDGVHASDTALVRRWAGEAGFEIERVRLDRSPKVRQLTGWLPRAVDIWLGRTVVASLQPTRAAV
jgi:SAM-dependent methyltransferase